jgi:hypothetical protein
LRHQPTNEYKANPEFVWNAIIYQYSSVFYLPNEPKYDILESVVQFDRMTTLHKSWLLEPRKAQLTNEAVICISAWLQNYITGIVPKTFNEDLESYREMLGENPKIRTGLFGK